MITAYYKSPAGTIEISHNGKGISSLIFIDDEFRQEQIPEGFSECFKQLDEYFTGTRQLFDLSLSPQGTEFQQFVWNKLLEIPYGKTTTYLEIARRVGNTKSLRAVGNANGRNPISIIIPCHRVIGSDGSLTGYGGGLWRKKWLLEHEQQFAQLSLF